MARVRGRGPKMRDGIAYINRLKYLLERDEQPLPEGIIVSQEMFGAIEHEYPAICRFSEIFGMKMRMATMNGMKIYRGME